MKFLAAVASTFAVHTASATCYNLHGTMADNSYTRPHSIAHNYLPFGTKIELVGRSFYGERRFVVRDTGPALADGHFDIWYNGHSCAAWGRRVIRYRIGWTHYVARLIKRYYF